MPEEEEEEEEEKTKQNKRRHVSEPSARLTFVAGGAEGAIKNAKKEAFLVPRSKLLPERNVLEDFAKVQGSTQHLESEKQTAGRHEGRHCYKHRKHWRLVHILKRVKLVKEDPRQK